MYITSKNIKTGYLDLTDVEFIDKDQHAEIFRRCDVRAGDILLTKDGASTGNAALNTIAEEISLLSSIAFLRVDNTAHNAAYFLQSILSQGGQRQIQDQMAGNAITRLTLEKIKNLRFPVPPSKCEEHAIAGALSDADALIESLETLIAKKRAIKQGAMQELLSGRRRLPGFNDIWAMRTLADFGSTYGGLTGKTKDDFGCGQARYIPFLNVMNNVVVDLEELPSVRLKDGEIQNKVRSGDIFFNGSSETPEEVGMCSLLLYGVADLYLNSFCFGFRVRDNTLISALFLTYLFRSDRGRHLIASLAQGAIRYNLSKKALLAISFECPYVKEQTAIATLLSDMDDELKHLEERLSKARQIKQGMMQELLTGRIRLV